MVRRGSEQPGRGAALPQHPALAGAICLPLNRRQGSSCFTSARSSCGQDGTEIPGAGAQGMSLGVRAHWVGIDEDGAEKARRDEGTARCAEQLSEN